MVTDMARYIQSKSKICQKILVSHRRDRQSATKKLPSGQPRKKVEERRQSEYAIQPFSKEETKNTSMVVLERQFC